MNRLAILYHPHDRQFTFSVATDLENAGAAIWIAAQPLPLGRKWNPNLREGLKVADLMILILSPEAMRDEIIHEHWESFLQTGKPLVPLYWRECEPHYKLSRLQYIDFRPEVISYPRAFNHLLVAMAEDHAEIMDLQKPASTNAANNRLVADIILDQTGRYPSFQIPLEEDTALTGRKLWWLSVMIVLFAVGLSAFILLADDLPNFFAGTETATATSAPEVAPSASPEPKATLLLDYTEDVFRLTNISSTAQSIRALEFRSLNEAISPYFVQVYWSNLTYLKGLDVIDRLPSGSCLMNYAGQVTTFAPNDTCRIRQGWTTLSQRQIFWQTGFQVYNGEVLIADCPPAPNQCALP